MNDQDTNNSATTPKNIGKKARPKTSRTPGSDQGRADGGRDKQEKHPGGRPTDYTPELLKQARGYLFVATKGRKDGFMPSIADLAFTLDISRETVYEWAKDELKPEFSDIVERVMTLQELSLTENGLKGNFNSTITKLMLSKHGYTDKSEIDHNNPDGNLKTIIINKSENSNDKPTA